MFQGSFVALVTPFDAQGRVNFDKLAQLCKWHVAQGTAGIVALGTTGESRPMSHEEDEDGVRCVMETVVNTPPFERP